MIPFVLDRPALVIELKKDKSDGNAIARIKEKHCNSGLDAYAAIPFLAGSTMIQKRSEP